MARYKTIRSRTTCLLFDGKPCSFVINAAGGRQYFTCSSVCLQAVCTVYKQNLVRELVRGGKVGIKVV